MTWTAYRNIHFSTLEDKYKNGIFAQHHYLVHTITYYGVFGIGDPKNATLIIHFNYKNNSKENYILFDIADITDLLMIIVKTQILFYVPSLI